MQFYLTIEYFRCRLRSQPLDTPLRPDGLVFHSYQTGLMLKAEQEGDKTLVRDDIVGALDAVLNYYKNPKGKPSTHTNLVEVHVLQGYFLQGLVNVTLLEGDGVDGTGEIDTIESVQTS